MTLFQLYDTEQFTIPLQQKFPTIVSFDLQIQLTWE